MKRANSKRKRKIQFDKRGNERNGHKTFRKSTIKQKRGNRGKYKRID